MEAPIYVGWPLLPMEACLHSHDGPKSADGNWDGKNQQEVYVVQCDEGILVHFMSTN